MEVKPQPATLNKTALLFKRVGVPVNAKTPDKKTDF
jgi:hypothetical protein